MTCKQVRSVVDGVRYDTQSQINYVILDVANKEDQELARELGILGFPRICTIDADGATVLERHAGPIDVDTLTQIIAEAVEPTS